ncbi:MAG: sialidase family protein, partial [Acidimicrobiales bacterium]
VGVAALAGPARAAAAPAVLPDVPVSGLDERLQLSHNSPVLRVDPTRPDFVVLANRLDNPEFGCTLHLSGDGGRGWIPVKPVPKLPEGVEQCYAPEAAFDRDGLLYYLFVGLAGPGNAPVGAFLVTSGDRGRTFTDPRPVLGPERYQVRMALDPTSGPRGRLHLVWLEAGSDPPLGGLGPPPNPIMTAHSDDGGRSFSEPARISDPSRRVVAPALAAGADHRVHVLFYDLEDDARDYQGLEGPVWEGRWSLHLARSTDGGATFADPVEVEGGIVPTERVMLIYTMPAPALAVAPSGGEVYAAWADARHGDWDVLARRSTDGGATWEPAVRLNDDPVGNGRHQYLPALSAAADGRVDAVFLDRRDDPGNVRNHTYLATSTDRGARFGANLRVSTEPSDTTIGTRYDVTSALGLVEFGSRLAVLSLPDRTLAAWPDTRNGELGEYSQDVFATEVAFGPRPAHDDSSTPVLPVAGGAAAAALLAAAAALRARRRPTTAASGPADATGTGPVPGPVRHEERPAPPVTREGDAG